LSTTAGIEPFVWAVRKFMNVALMDKKSILKFCVKSVLKKKEDLPALVASPLGRLCMMNRKCSIEIVESCIKDNYYSPWCSK
jgi:hypothetical protein